MTLKPWITSLAVVSTLTVTGLASAQQPQAQPQSKPSVTDRMLIQNGTTVPGVDGNPILKVDAPTIDRPTIQNGSVPTTADGKPFTTSTNFGMR